MDTINIGNIQPKNINGLPIANINNPNNATAKDPITIKFFISLIFYL